MSSHKLCNFVLPALLFAGLCSGAWSAETSLSNGVIGIWNDSTAASQAGDPWQVHWIWAKDDEANMLLARRAFEVSTIPDSARLRITASSIYKLYINGQYVSRGPARSAPHHQAYDEFEVGSLLKKGKNVLAVRVHYQKGTVSHHHNGRAGLLAQMDISLDSKDRTISTDSSWRVLPDPAWDPESPLISRFHLEATDVVDLRDSVGDWTSSGYDDRGWAKAVSLIRNVGWPAHQKNARPTVLMPPWTSLQRRDIPYLVEKDVLATKLIQSQPIQGKIFKYAGSKPGKLPLIKAVQMNGKVDPLSGKTALKDNDWFFLYDFGTVINGMPRLDIEGPAGTVVDVMCAPFVVNDTFTANIVDSLLIDRIILSGQRDKWEATYFKPTRYLGIAIRGADGPVQVHAAGIHQISYPFEIKGSLHTPENPWFEDCWKAAAKTIDVCTTDAYTDNYRERRQYVQTAYFAALGNYWTFGDMALQRRYLKQAAEEQEANGMMPAYAPLHGDDFMVILDGNTSWIRGLRNYLLYSGDFETVRELLPAGRKLMSLLNSFTNDMGLFNNPPYSYWLDHAPLDRRGANLCMNGHYLGTLQDWADILDWMHEPGAEQLRSRADTLRASLSREFWNPDKGLFCDAWIDGEQSEVFSEHGNALALIMHVATEEQGKIIAEQLLRDDDENYVTRDTGTVIATPLMAYFLQRGLAQYGYAEESLVMFQDRFDKMLDPATNQTLWEEWWRDGTGRTGKLVRGRTRSDAQTESAFPPALFGELILGIQPVKPGLKEIELSIPECGLNDIKGSLPTPMGLLSVEWNLKRGELDIEIPEGMLVHFSMKAGTMSLTTGKHHVQF